MANHNYDVIVAGARCGGAPVAMLLARRGYRVLLMDKAKLPADKPLSTHLLVCSGVAALKRWGLLEEVAASNCPPYRTITLDFYGKIRFDSNSPAAEGADCVYAPRRSVLDDILLRAAIQAGVEFRCGFGVEELVYDDGHVCGIRGRELGQTDLHTETARLVIGADGVYSKVAQLVGAQKYHEEPEASAAWFSYWSGVPTKTIQAYFRPARFFVAYQTNDGLTLAATYMPLSEAAVFKTDIETNFHREVSTHVPELADQLAAGKREEKWIGTDHQPNYYRQSYGPGWALVGDAATHHDSMNPTGMTNAFTGAEYLVDAVDQGLGGKQDLDTALAGYQARRDERWLGHFGFITQLAKLEPPAPEMVALIGKIASKPAEAAAFGAFFQGHQEYLNFFAPDNLQRIMSN
jgi:2-polyprenyl-6-methoxyphenol hydroxylase-like FAD-dependent oxidoreductase